MTMDYWTAARTYADPLGHVEDATARAARRKTRDRALHHDERVAEEEAQRVDRVETIEGTFDPRVFAPREQREERRQAIDVEDGGELSAEQVAAMFGLPERTVKYEEPGEPPEVAFARAEAKRRIDGAVERVQAIRDKLAAKAAGR